MILKSQSDTQPDTSSLDCVKPFGPPLPHSSEICELAYNGLFHRILFKCGKSVSKYVVCKQNLNYRHQFLLFLHSEIMDIYKTLKKKKSRQKITQTWMEKLN